MGEMPMSSQLKNNKRISEHFNISQTDFHYWNGYFKRLFFKREGKRTEIDDHLNIYGWPKRDAPHYSQK